MSPDLTYIESVDIMNSFDMNLVFILILCALIGGFLSHYSLAHWKNRSKDRVIADLRKQIDRMREG